MGTPRQSWWTNEMVEFLTHLLLVDKLSFGVARVRFNAQFNADKTRNALIGKMHRMGILVRESVRSGERKVLVRQRKPPKPQAVKKQKPWAPKKEVPFVFTSVPIDEIEVEAHRCQYPTNSDISHLEVCGKPAVVGPYCDTHAHIAYRVMPTKRREVA